MALVANNPKAAKRLGISSKVGKEFMKADKGKKFASGGMSRPAALERRRQQEYLERNPQYSEREEGLESVSPERFLIPGGAAKTGAAAISRMAKPPRTRKFRPQDPPPVGKTPGAYRDPAAKREADKAMRERIKQAEAEKDKLRSVARPTERSKDRLPYEPRPQSDESSYRKGGSVKSSASRRADGIAQRGKTRGKFI